MKSVTTLAAALALCALALPAEPAAPESSALTDEAVTRGAPSPESISVLTFAPDGTLFLGDSIGGAVFAIETKEPETGAVKALAVQDLETKIAARLGTHASDVLVHDLAVHPISHRVFLAVSNGRAGWDNEWKLPNHVANAHLILTLDAEGSLDEYPLDDVRYARVELPNPVSAEKRHAFIEGLSLRTDTITDIGYTEDTLFVSGLSNEEFASTLWRLPLPLGSGASATTLEIYHGAHGAYETHAPIRTFVPYELDGEQYILASYLCTPFTLFKVSELKSGAHVKGRTIAELGSGNYPLDMVVVHRESGDRLFLANSALGLTIIDAADVESFEGTITERPEGYTAGVEHTTRSPSGLQQLDVLGDEYLLLLQRQSSGRLDLSSLPLRRG